MLEVPPEPVFFRFRVDPEIRRLLDRLREEKDINVSAWTRRVLRHALHLEFPDATTTAPEPVQTPPIETPEAPEPDPQKPPVETGGAPEPDPKKALIEGWRPRQLDNGKWGAVLEGPRVAELPKNDRLPGTPIRVTDKKGESWTTTLTEVINKTDTTIVVTNSGRPRS